MAFFEAGSFCVSIFPDKLAVACRGWEFLCLNIFHANGLSPSGGHILSSPAKKEYGKKDAAQGGGFPALRTHPLGWVSVVRVVMFRLPDKLASASVPCKLVCGPLAASLLLTDCGCGLGDFFRSWKLLRFKFLPG